MPMLLAPGCTLAQFLFHFSLLKGTVMGGWAKLRNLFFPEENEVIIALEEKEKVKKEGEALETWACDFIQLRGLSPNSRGSSQDERQRTCHESFSTLAGLCQSLEPWV